MDPLDNLTSLVILWPLFQKMTVTLFSHSGFQDIGHMLDQQAAHALSDSDDDDNIYNDYM